MLGPETLFFLKLRSCDSTLANGILHYFPEHQGLLVQGNLSFRKCDFQGTETDFT